MSRLMMAAVLLATIATSGASAPAQPAREPATCRGVTLALFEQRVPDHTRRFAFEGDLLTPFLELWKAGQRPRLPAPPQSVVVYALPERPYLVGYQREGCVIAVLAVERRALWKLLQPQLGWPA
jgi:hypothetical protein